MVVGDPAALAGGDGSSAHEFFEGHAVVGGESRAAVTAWLTGVTQATNLTHMVKTQVYLRPEELDALHRTARRSGRPVADLVREAIRRVWLRPTARGPVALWDGLPTRTSVEHDTIYDEP